MKKTHYDAVIIGGGIGGLMAAYRLAGKMSVLLIEKGRDIERRKCPIVAKTSPVCTKCKPCAIMEGIGGAGAFSDGKYVISTEYGGWLTNFLSAQTVLSYIEEGDKILMENGATAERFHPDDKLKLKCLQHDLHMQQAQLKHLGTDENYRTMVNMVAKIKDKCEVVTETAVTDVDIKKQAVSYAKNGVSGTVTAENIIFAVGRAGSKFFTDWAISQNIKLFNNQVDVGVRVELPRLIWDAFSREIYEPKILYRSKSYGDVTRMFCFNEGGQVVMENTDGVLTVNGHAYRDEKKKSANSNFALLTTTRFTEPFREPIEYARYIASLANKISGGAVLVQRFGDLIAGRRSNEARLRQSTTVPTLAAVPGDLALCMPKRQLDNIIETLYALDRVAPGTANHDTLLYGAECKYYSARPETEEGFRLKGTRAIYAIGDGAGFTRSLSHAGAQGLYVADFITTC